MNMVGLRMSLISVELGGSSAPSMTKKSKLSTLGQLDR
jgi:hypothetical protein